METTLIQQMQATYQQYFDTVAEIRARVPHAKGILGIGNVLQRDLCHTHFAEAMDRLLQQAAPNIDADEAEAALRLLADTAQAHADDHIVYTMLQAVQGYGQVLVPRLTPVQATALVTRYAELYPANQRLPAQKQLLKELKKAGKAADDGSKRWSLFRK